MDAEEKTERQKEKWIKEADDAEIKTNLETLQ